MLSDGLHDVPPGKIAVVVTYLEMRDRPAPRPWEFPDGVTIEQIENPDSAWYRDLFRRVGGEDWLWFSRLAASEAELAATLAKPEIDIYAVMKDGVAEGLLELAFRDAETCELAFFGLTSVLIGSGTGRALMNFAIDAAWSRPIKRFCLQTCTADSPQALPFYIRSGFAPTHRRIEIADDPRLTGVLPKTAGPHMPIFKNQDA